MDYNHFIRHNWHIMAIAKQMTDEEILRELGERLAKVRLERNLTQAELAQQAGVSKRTVERLEVGGATQLSSFIRLCRALDLIERFDRVIPEPVPSPIAQVKLHGKARRRASSIKTPDHPLKKWTWGESI